MKTSKKAARKSSVTSISKKPAAPKAMPARSDAFASKLNLPIADAIRSRVGKGEKPSRLAKEYGCSFGAVRAILEYRSYCPEGLLPIAVPVAAKTHAKIALAAKKAGISIGEYVARLVRHAVGEAAA